MEFNLYGDYVLYFGLINYIPKYWLHRLRNYTDTID